MASCWLITSFCKPWERVTGKTPFIKPQYKTTHFDLPWECYRAWVVWRLCVCVSLHSKTAPSILEKYQCMVFFLGSVHCYEGDRSKTLKSLSVRSFCSLNEQLLWKIVRGSSSTWHFSRPACLCLCLYKSPAVRIAPLFPLSPALSAILSLGLSLFVLTSRHTLLVKVEQGAETVSHHCRAQSKVPWLHHRSTLTNTLTHTPTVAPIEGNPRLSLLPVLSDLLRE